MKFIELTNLKGHKVMVSITGILTILPIHEGVKVHWIKKCEVSEFRESYDEVKALIEKASEGSRIEGLLAEIYDTVCGIYNAV